MRLSVGVVVGGENKGPTESEKGSVSDVLVRVVNVKMIEAVAEIPWHWTFEIWPEGAEHEDMALIGRV